MAWTTPGTAVAGEVLTAAFWNQQVRDNSLELAPFFSAWTSYTPVVEQVSARTATIQNARYLIVGKRIRVNASMTITQAGTAGQHIAVSLPTALVSRITGNDHAVGSFFYQRLAGTRYAGTAIIAVGFTGSSKLIFISGSAGTSVLGIDPSIATVNGDIFSFTVEYEIS